MVLIGGIVASFISWNTTPLRKYLLPLRSNWKRSADIDVLVWWELAAKMVLWVSAGSARPSFFPSESVYNIYGNNQLVATARISVFMWFELDYGTYLSSYHSYILALQGMHHACAGTGKIFFVEDRWSYAQMDTPTVSAVSEAISSRRFLSPGTYVWKWSLPWMLPVNWSPPQAVWLEWWPCHSNNVFGVLFQDVMLVDQDALIGFSDHSGKEPIGGGGISFRLLFWVQAWVPVETFISRTYVGSGLR